MGLHQYIPPGPSLQKAHLRLSLLYCCPSTVPILCYSLRHYATLHDPNGSSQRIYQQHGIMMPAVSDAHICVLCAKDGPVCTIQSAIIGAVCKTCIISQFRICEKSQTYLICVLVTCRRRHPFPLKARSMRTRVIYIPPNFATCPLFAITHHA